MRGKTLTRGAWLLAACLALASAARGQAPGTAWLPAYAPADPVLTTAAGWSGQLPFPLGSTRPEDGGLYAVAEFMEFRQTNPLHSQLIAVSGFKVSDNSFQNFRPGDFVGSSRPRLNVDQLTGQDSYQPGFRVGVGYKFGDESALYLSWFWLTEASYRNGVTGEPPLGRSAPGLADSFLFAPVTNWPPQYAGPDFKVNPTNGLTGVPIQLVSAQAVTGIWNGAFIMTEDFIQRFQEWEITYRQVVYETEDMRINGLVGPRFTWLWERYRWTTTAFGQDLTGAVVAGPQDTAIYSNITSNRMYGAHAGCQWECYLGHGFALMAEGQGALFLDSIKEIARYELAAKFLGFPENKRSKNIWNIVPELQGSVGIMWYPWENVQVSVGYQVMAFFNTLGSHQPIDFNYTNLAPKWDTTLRYFDGFTAGFSIHF
jgi:hypothetical protein